MVGFVGLARAEIEGVEEAIHAVAGATPVLPSSRLPQPARHPLIVIGELLQIDPFLKADGLIVADPLQDVLKPQAGGWREHGTDRCG
jgi:hypothetical protein